MIIKKYPFILRFSFEVISTLKISTIAAKLIILRPLLQFLTETLEILKLRNNYYHAPEIEKKIGIFFDRVTFLEQAIFRSFRAP